MNNYEKYSSLSKTAVFQDTINVGEYSATVDNITEQSTPKELADFINLKLMESINEQLKENKIVELPQPAHL